MTATDLISTKGTANSYNEWLPGYTVYSYEKLSIVVKGKRVCAIISTEPSVSTKRGIHPGSSVEELQKSYGKTLTRYYSQWLYDFMSDDEQKCYVGFEVGNGAVLKICIADRDVFDFMAASYSLLTFHELITKREYDNAFDYYLTENMKKQLASYERWKAGYHNTVSSKIKKINSVRKISDDAVELTYDLEGVDDPGGTHYFTGKAIVKKNGGFWAIDRMENR